MYLHNMYHSPVFFLASRNDAPAPAPRRLQEADRALSQALCLGLADPSLLREIGNCYVAAGRLDAAEDALRKSLAADASGSSSSTWSSGGGIGAAAGGGGGVGNPHTRRCLADVLSARNSTSQVRYVTLRCGFMRLVGLYAVCDYGVCRGQGVVGSMEPRGPPSCSQDIFDCNLMYP